MPTLTACISITNAPSGHTAIGSLTPSTTTSLLMSSPWSSWQATYYPNLLSNNASPQVSIGATSRLVKVGPSMKNSYVRYAVDRVETTSTVWMGLTSGCAACHDHKFDPISQKEFYQLFSYFYSLTEKAMDGNVNLPPPSIKVPTATQAAEKSALDQELKDVRNKVTAIYKSIDYKDARCRRNTRRAR